MDRLFTSANLYYATLERFGPRFWLRTKWAWIMALASGALLYGVWLYFSKVETLRANSYWPLFYIAAPEIAFLISLEKLRAIKKSEALFRINAKYKKEFTSLTQARRFLLILFFGRNENDYLKFTEEISKALTHQENLRTPVPTRFADAARLVYDPDSKQRIYALLIVIASAVTALAIREGAGISNIFELCELGIGIILSAWFMLTLTFGLFLVALIFCRIGLIAAISYLLLLYYGKSARDPMTLKYLQRELLSFHRFVHLPYTNKTSPLSENN